MPIYTTMKRVLLLLCAALIAIAPLSAQRSYNSRAIHKMAKKEAKRVAKEGYELREAGDLEVLMAEHFERLFSETAIEFVGVEEGNKRLNVAISKARRSVLSECVGYASSVIKGRITTDISVEGAEQMDRFLATYERHASTGMDGQIRTSFTLVRYDKKSEKYDVKLVCYVERDAMNQMLRQSLKRAAEETMIAQEYEAKLSEFIDDDKN